MQNEKTPATNNKHQHVDIRISGVPVKVSLYYTQMATDKGTTLSALLKNILHEYKENEERKKIKPGTGV